TGFRTTPSFYPSSSANERTRLAATKVMPSSRLARSKLKGSMARGFPGLELNEHQRWVRTGFRQSPLRGERALGYDQTTLANALSRRLSGLRQPPGPCSRRGNQSTNSKRGPGTGPTDCPLRPQRPSMSVKRGAGGSAATRDVEPCLAQALRCEKVRHREHCERRPRVCWRTSGSDRQTPQFSGPRRKKAASLAS